MCASPLSPRHAQPDWMGGGLASRQMMHAPPSAAISLSKWIGAGPTKWGVWVRGVPPNGRAKKTGLPDRCLATGGMDSSFAGLGAAPRVAPERSLHRLSMRYDVDRRHGVSFSGSETARQELLPPDAIAVWYGSRCGGRVGQSRRHDQEEGVSIVREAGPRRGRQDPWHQDCCSGSATRRAPEYGHPRSIRGLHLLVHRRAPCAFSPRTRQNERRARQSERRSELRGSGPVPPASTAFESRSFECSRA